MKRVAPKTVDAYLKGVAQPARATLEKLRATIKSVVPKAGEVISYQMPAFRLERGLVYYAAFKNHCSIFAELADDLTDYKTSKGTLQFALDRPLPSRLVKKLVKTRLAEIAERKRKAAPRR